MHNYEHVDSNSQWKVIIMHNNFTNLLVSAISLVKNIWRLPQFSILKLISVYI